MQCVQFVCRRNFLVYFASGLKYTGFHGTLPTDIGLLRYLETLDIRENELSGTIPSELGLLTSLIFLLLSDNRFHGTIPTQLARLSLLKEFELQSNYLSGSVSFLKEWAETRSVDNDFSCFLVQFQTCLSDRNCFECPIPSAISDVCIVHE